MSKIYELFTFKLLLLFSTLFFIFSLLSYFLIKFTLIESYLLLWIELEVVLASLFLIAFLVINKMNRKVKDEIKELKEYLNAVSDKNYEAVLKINSFYEFLEISLILKNIVKRLNNKDKKKK